MLEGRLLGIEKNTFCNIFPKKCELYSPLTKNDNLEINSTHEF